MAQDWPSKSEVDGISYETVGDRLDAIDNKIVAAGGAETALPSALLATDLARVRRGADPHTVPMSEVWRQSTANAGTITQTGTGAVAHGFASNYGSIQATSDGAFASGCAYRPIIASGLGSFARGLSGGGAAGLVASGAGSVAMGRTGYDGTMLSSGAGSVAMGFAYQSSDIVASAKGAMAMGYAHFFKDITASGVGAFAIGQSHNGAITASGEGSFAQGKAVGVDIIASGTNSVQFGPGTNATDNTVQFGAGGLRLKQTVGAPAVLQNGDLWVANNYVYVRSNGVSVKIT